MLARWCTKLVTAVIEHPSTGSSFLASIPANFFSSSLSVPASFFLLPLFLAQLHILFCLSSLHAPSFSIPTSQMLPDVFVNSVVVSRSLHHTTLHSTQSTSLDSSIVLFPRSTENASLPVISFFCHCYPLLYFLTAVHVSTDFRPQVFEAVHLFNGFTFSLPFIIIPHTTHLHYKTHTVTLTSLLSIHIPPRNMVLPKKYMNQK